MNEASQLARYPNASATFYAPAAQQWWGVDIVKRRMSFQEEEMFMCGDPAAFARVGTTKDDPLFF